MRPHIGFALIIIFALLLGACAPGAASPTTTPVPSGGGVAPTSGSASDAGSSNPLGGTTDSSTGLIHPVFGAVPSSASAPATSSESGGTAVISIAGPLPLTKYDGQCDVIDDELYLSAPPVAQALPPYASLIIYRLSDEGNVRGGTVIWATSGAPTDSALVTANDIFFITLNEDGLSGSFAGTAHRVTSGVPVTEQIEISGVFSCVAHFVRVGGEHPVDMTDARCTTDPLFTLRSGGLDGNAVLLNVATDVTPGSSGWGGIAWRVGGVSYSSNWLLVTVNPDGISGGYFGEGTNPDGSTFQIDGTFNCLGS